MRWILIFLTINVCYGQKEIHISELPAIIDGDTLFCKHEIWVESVDDEIHQRHKINVLKRKLNHIKVVLKHKEGYEASIDSLIVQMDKIEAERDSLLTIIDSDISNVNSEVKNQLLNSNKQLNIVKEQYFILKEKKRKVAKVAVVSICTNILLLSIIIIAI